MGEMMCFSTPKVETPPIPDKPAPDKVAAESQYQEQRRRAARTNQQSNILTSSLGASNYGQNTNPSVTLLGRA